MIFRQELLTIKTKKRGFHLITDDILHTVNLKGIKVGLLNLFLKHTSASLTINENVSFEVWEDLENISSSLVPDGDRYLHYLEGEDDMPAHFKSSMFGVSLNIPISYGKLQLGTWQGIFLCEHRNNPSFREIVITVTGESDIFFENREI